MHETNEKKPWKLFGKLNVIDLLIIVIVIAALILLGTRVLGNRGGPGANAQHVRITFYGFEEVQEYVPQAFTKGDPVSQYQSELNLGTLEDFSWEPAFDLVYDAELGETVQMPRLGEVFVTFTSDCYGKYGPTGLTIGDTTFVVGGNYYVNVGPTRAGYQIKSFELLD